MSSNQTATHERLLAACREHGFTITADERIGEPDAAVLLGLSLGGLRNMRMLGTGPAFYRRPAGGSRVSYRIADIATWLEDGREEW